jgi:hypothetical protein
VLGVIIWWFGVKFIHRRDWSCSRGKRPLYSFDSHLLVCLLTHLLTHLPIHSLLHLLTCSQICIEHLQVVKMPALGTQSRALTVPCSGIFWESL